MSATFNAVMQNVDEVVNYNMPYGHLLAYYRGYNRKIGTHVACKCKNENYSTLKANIQELFCATRMP